MLRRPCSQNGFTLLEVMIALAIVAIALVTLLGLSNSSILAQERIQKLTRATLLAQQLMSEQEVEQNRDWQPKEDVFEEPFAEFRWRITYQDTMLSTIKQVNVEVIWGDEGKNELVRLASLVR